MLAASTGTPSTTLLAPNLAHNNTAMPEPQLVGGHSLCMLLLLIIKVLGPTTAPHKVVQSCGGLDEQLEWTGKDIQVACPWRTPS